MKINFSNPNSLDSVKNSVAVFVLTEEETKNSHLKAVKFAKENFDFSGKVGMHLVAQDDKVVVVVGLGSEKKLTSAIIQKLGAKIVAFLKKCGIISL